MKIYQKIRELAHQGETVYTRADLAYDLQQLGISNDCFEVGLLVWEAYRHFNQDDAIRTFFYDNERKGLLVDEYQADGLIAGNETKRLFEMEQQRLTSWNKAMKTVETTIAEVMQDDAVHAGSHIAGTIIGTKGVERIRQEAATVFNKYSKLVGQYDDAKQQIGLLVTDFVKLRAYICDIYRRYSLMLTDAFGDSIKAIAPELFDFESIRFLDVHAMLQEVRLDYDKVNEKCSLLMSDISESFAQSLKMAGISYRNAGSKQAGLIMAGLNMFSHYMETGEKVAGLKQDMIVLKNSVNHDLALIKGDLSRLCVLYKSLNDVSIPEAEAFCKYARQVLTEEWQQLADALYNQVGIRQLKEERDRLLNRQKLVEQEMDDEKLNIGYYSERIATCGQLLDSMQEQYQKAMRTKPSRPFFLLNLLTFGASNRAYNRDIYEWNQTCNPVVTQYRNLQVDVKLDSDELARLQAALKKHQAEYSQLQQALRRQNKSLMEHIRANRDVRLKMLPHLEAMVNLLRLGRQIANTQLDRTLTQTVVISPQMDIRIPENLSQKITAFSKAVRENVNVTPQLIQDLMNSAQTTQHTTSKAAQHNQNSPGSPTADKAPNDRNYTAQGQSELAAMGNKAVRDTTAFLEAAIRLEAMKTTSRMAENRYNQELTALQNQFREYLSHIDNKSAVLAKSLQQINTAQNQEQLKKGLLSLIGQQNDLIKKEDLEDFINGTKTITL